MTPWRSDPKERLRWVQELVRDEPRHPFSFLWRHQSWAGIAARRNLMGLKLKRDEPLRQRLIRGILSEQYLRGGFRCSVGWTGLRLLHLFELGVPRDHPAIVKALAWLRGRQDTDGNFIELPTIPTAYPSVWGEEVRFPLGSVGVTAFVLCGVLRWDRESRWVQRAVLWVARRLVEMREICCRPCAVHALHALSLSQMDTLLVRLAMERIFLWLGAHQSEQGEWFSSPESVFPVLFGLCVCPLPGVQAQITKAFPCLAGMQFSDGGWGRAYRAEKTWLVAKAFVFHGLLDAFHDFLRLCPWLGRPKDWLERMPPSLDELSSGL